MSEAGNTPSHALITLIISTKKLMALELHRRELLLSCCLAATLLLWLFLDISGVMRRIITCSLPTSAFFLPTLLAFV